MDKKTIMKPTYQDYKKHISENNDFLKQIDPLDLILFGQWLEMFGWQMYDGWDRWINTGLKNIVVEITELYNDYKKENNEA